MGEPPPPSQLAVALYVGRKVAGAVLCGGRSPRASEGDPVLENAPSLPPHAHAETAVLPAEPARGVRPRCPLSPPAPAVDSLAAATFPLHPRSRLKRRWDWLVVCVVVLTTTIMPLDVGLYDDDCPSGPPPEPLGGYVALAKTCLAEPFGNLTAAAQAGGSGEESWRDTMRVHCRPAGLDTLEWVLDSVFYADVLLKFVTAVPVERTLDVKCAPSRLREADAADRPRPAATSCRP